MIPGQFPALHATAVVVDNGDGRRRRIRQQANSGSAGVERVGDDLCENRFFERTAVGVPKVFEQMLEVDARFAHVRMLPRAAHPPENGSLGTRCDPEGALVVF